MKKSPSGDRELVVTNTVTNETASAKYAAAEALANAMAELAKAIAHPLSSTTISGCHFECNGGSAVSVNTKE